MKISTVLFGVTVADYFWTVEDPAGTITSVGYPGGYSKVRIKQMVLKKKKNLRASNGNSALQGLRNTLSSLKTSTSMPIATATSMSMTAATLLVGRFATLTLEK